MGNLKVLGPSPFHYIKCKHLTATPSLESKWQEIESSFYAHELGIYP